MDPGTFSFSLGVLSLSAAGLVAYGLAFAVVAVMLAFAYRIVRGWK